MILYQGISAHARYVEPVHYYTSVDAWKRFETGSTRNGYEPFCSVDRPIVVEDPWRKQQTGYWTHVCRMIVLVQLSSACSWALILNVGKFLFFTTRIFFRRLPAAVCYVATQQQKITVQGVKCWKTDLYYKYSAYDPIRFVVHSLSQWHSVTQIIGITRLSESLLKHLLTIECFFMMWNFQNQIHNSEKEANEK